MRLYATFSRVIVFDDGVAVADIEFGGQLGKYVHHGLVTEL